MIRVYIDESGDLGFSEGSSKWFILTLLITGDYRRVEKVIKRTHKGLRKKYRNIGELHAYHVTDSTRKKILRGLGSLKDCSILCVILDKGKVYVDLRSQKKYLYNYLTNILLERLHRKKIVGGDDKIEIFIDQRETNKFINNSFKKYINKNKLVHNKKFEIHIVPSHSEKCLQAVDFVSWAIFRKYEIKDSTFYTIIKAKIIGESKLFK